MKHKMVAQNEPIRLFKSVFLESLTHIHPAIVLAIWLPVSAFFLGGAIFQHPAHQSAWYIPTGFATGLFLWSLAEYL